MTNHTQDDQTEAVKIAGEWTKQLGLLATGTIVVSLSFLKDFVREGMVPLWKVELLVSWILLLLSVVAGHFAFGAPITGAGQEAFALRVNKQTRVLSQVQLWLFSIGVLGVITFAAFHLSVNAESVREPGRYRMEGAAVFDSATGDLFTSKEGRIYRVNLPAGTADVSEIRRSEAMKALAKKELEDERKRTLERCTEVIRTHDRKRDASKVKRGFDDVLKDQEYQECQKVLAENQDK